MTRPARVILLSVATVAIAFAAWQGGRRAERIAIEERSPTDAPPPATEKEDPGAGLPEFSATFEVPVAIPAEEQPATPAIVPTDVARIAPAAPPEPAAAPEPPRDEPSRCLTLEASPSSVSAYGSAGPAVQLVVRARNGCATGFSGPSTYFRAVAVSMEGFELGSATGRFSSEIRPYGTAETLVAIEADPTRVRTWRVELR